MTWLSKKPIIALAPMADMTDSPFCRVCREVSGNDFVIFREMVSAEAIVRGNEKTFKMCEFEEIERPIVIQLFGSNAEVIVEAAKLVVGKYHPDGIDINMGCPVPKIAGKGNSGSALMKDHKRAVEIVKTLKEANLGISVSVKTRLGWSKKDEILGFVQELEQAGADAVTIHGRTKTQGYSGVADWEMIGRAKKLVKIPVIANGDIKSAEDIQKCLRITGADGVMIGRAALGNPWIFGVESYKVHKVKSSELKRVVLRHAELHLQRYGEEYGLKTFRKHLLCYFKGMPEMKEIKQELVKIKNLEDLKNVFKKIPE